MAKLIFNIVSRKGGSGKSTLALLLARYYAMEKKTPVIYLDLDFPGAAIFTGLKRLIDQPERLDKCLNEKLVDSHLFSDGYTKCVDFKRNDVDNSAWCKLFPSRIEPEEHPKHRPFLEVEEASHFFFGRYIEAAGKIISDLPDGNEWVLILDHSPGMSGLSRRLFRNPQGAKSTEELFGSYLGPKAGQFRLVQCMVSTTDLHDLFESISEFRHCLTTAAAKSDDKTYLQELAKEDGGTEEKLFFPYYLIVNRVRRRKVTDPKPKNSAEAKDIFRGQITGDTQLSLPLKGTPHHDILDKRLLALPDVRQLRLFDVMADNSAINDLDGLWRGECQWLEGFFDVKLTG